jgi:nicotinamide riboside kinase
MLLILIMLPPLTEYLTDALGVRDRARGEFWRYLRHALTRHREKFAEAMRLAAVGYHFRKLTEGLNG